VMRARRNLLPALHSIVLTALVGANVSAALWWPIICLLTVPAAALAMCCALSAVHECAHRTYFSNRAANEMAGRLWALTILMNFTAYKRDHMLHHRHQGAERDTEPQIVLASRTDLIRSLLINPHIGAGWVASTQSAFGLVRVSRPARIDAMALLAVQSALVVAFLLSPVFVALAFAAPFLLSIVIDNGVSLPEHALVEGTSEQPVTRSLTASPVLNFLLYYVNRHIEHHQSPQFSAPALVSNQTAAIGVSYWQFYRSLWHALSRREIPGHAI
jgi:fatty acid desaturase